MNVRSVSQVAWCSAVLLGIMLLSACTALKLKYNALPSEQVFRHTVKYPGETLSIIAAWYCGSPRKVAILRDYNGRIAGAVLHIGDVVRIPAAETVEVRPLPQAYVESINARIREQVGSKTASATPERALSDAGAPPPGGESPDASADSPPQQSLPDEVLEELIEPLPMR